MIVRELMELLCNAAPHATVMMLDSYNESNAQPVMSLKVSELNWTIETGLSKGRPYECFYPGEPLPEPSPDLEQVQREQIPVLLLVPW